MAAQHLFASVVKRRLLRQFFLQESWRCAANSFKFTTPILSPKPSVVGQFFLVFLLQEGWWKAPLPVAVVFLPESLTYDPMKLFTKFVLLTSLALLTSGFIAKITGIQVRKESIPLRDFDIDQLLADFLAVLATLFTASVSYLLLDFPVTYADLSY